MELVLNTFGTSLGCDNDAFIVRNSNGSKRIPTDGITSIMVNRGVSLSMALPEEYRFEERTQHPASQSTISAQ